MTDFFTWIASAIGPLAKRVLSALGIGWISFEGLAALAEQVKTEVITSWGTLPSATLDVLSLAGFGVAIGITLGAIIARVTLVMLAKLGRMIV